MVLFSQINGEACEYYQEHEYTTNNRMERQIVTALENLLDNTNSVITIYSDSQHD